MLLATFSVLRLLHQTKSISSKELAKRNQLGGLKFYRFSRDLPLKQVELREMPPSREASPLPTSPNTLAQPSRHHLLSVLNQARKNRGLYLLIGLQSRKFNRT